LPERITKSLEKVLPFGFQSMTLMQWTEHFMGMYKNMQENKTVYKGVRNMTDKHFNNGKYTVNYDEIDFNEDLKDSHFQKTFLDYVKSNINPNGDKSISKYGFYTNAYFTLDLLGISKEQSKNVRFNNILNDGIHSRQYAELKNPHYLPQAATSFLGHLGKVVPIGLKTVFELLAIVLRAIVSSFSFVYLSCFIIEQVLYNEVQKK
jgi:hypothetical protein